MEVTYQQYITLDIPKNLTTNNIKFEGRIQEEDNNIYFDWSNTSFSFSAPIGTTSLFFRTQGICVFKVLCENLKIFRTPPYLPLPKEINSNSFALQSSYSTITVTNKTSSPQEIGFLKISEAKDGAVCLYGSNKEVLPIKEVPNRKKVEIIGDSLVCGYGMFPIENCKTDALQSDASETWAAQLTKHFNFESRTIGWSGIGMVRSYEEVEFPNDEHNISVLWEQTNAGEQKPQWKHEKWEPDYVIVNIGTNDFWDVGAVKPTRCDIPSPFCSGSECALTNLSQQLKETEKMEQQTQSQLVHEYEIGINIDEEKSDEVDSAQDSIKEDSGSVEETQSKEESPNKTKEKKQKTIETEEQKQKDIKTEVIHSVVQNWKLHKQSSFSNILDDFIANDDSDLDSVFESSCVQFFSKILKTHQTTEIFVVIGPVMPKEGEVAMKSAIRTINKTYPRRVHELNCQLCYTEKQRPCWGLSGFPTHVAHQIIYESLLPQIQTYLK
ncbi:SGNH hydrolase-type esterase domain-containing protein [Entamoeba marina]